MDAYIAINWLKQMVAKEFQLLFQSQFQKLFQQEIRILKRKRFLLGKQYLRIKLTYQVQHQKKTNFKSHTENMKYWKSLPIQKFSNTRTSKSLANAYYMIKLQIQRNNLEVLWQKTYGFLIYLGSIEIKTGFIQVSPSISQQKTTISMISENFKNIFTQKEQ